MFRTSRFTSQKLKLNVRNCYFSFIGRAARTGGFRRRVGNENGREKQLVSNLESYFNLTDVRC